MLDIPYYISNKFIYDDLKINIVRLEISKFRGNYTTRLSQHPNILATGLLDPTCVRFSRLKRINTLDLTQILNPEKSPYMVLGINGLLASSNSRLQY